jgi:vacuolar protein sorting-associated protein 35
MQEAMHILRGAMEANDLSTTLDRANAMLGELGDPKHYHHHHTHTYHPTHHHQHQSHGYSSFTNEPPRAVMSPKHYYELHMMALDELPNLEEYFLSISSPRSVEGCNIPKAKFTMREIYQMVQFSPRAVPRLYLMICAGSAWIKRSGEEGMDGRGRDGGHGHDGDENDVARFVLRDLKESVKCVQCPIRGLFLRHYLLQAVKDKLPDEKEEGMVEDVKGRGMDRGGGDYGQEEEGKEVGYENMQEEGVKEVLEQRGPHTAAMTHLMDDLLVGNGGDGGVGGGDGETRGSSLMDSSCNHGHSGDDRMTVTTERSWMEDLGVDLRRPSAAMATTSQGTFLDGLRGQDVPSMPMPSGPPPAIPGENAPVIREEVPCAGGGDDGGRRHVLKRGSVKDSYEFVLSNFIEMNKLWVRIQHMPGDLKTKEIRRQRERERNELRMMVGTNLVRLSELEGVTSAIYGTVILPKILDQIVACHDPLAQAYLMDCIIQVFPDEFHIQTLEVILSVCPKLRDKVNIRTILQSIMNRLANYYADELLLNDEEDTEGVKMSVMMDSFSMFEECIKSVLDARGVKLTAREAIRLESALMEFTLKCYPNKLDYMDRCLEVCASTLRGEGNHGIISASGAHVNVPPTPIPLDERAINELEKLLTLPLEELALGVLELRHYSQLLSLLPWENRRKLASSLLKVLGTSGERISSLNKLNELFLIITPLLQDKAASVGGEGASVSSVDQSLVSKVFRAIFHEDTDAHFDMLHAAHKKVLQCGGRPEDTVSIVNAALCLLNRVRDLEFLEVCLHEDKEMNNEEEQEEGVAVKELDEKESVNGAAIPAKKEKVFSMNQNKELQQHDKEDDLSYEDEKEEDDLSYGDVAEKVCDPIEEKDRIDTLEARFDSAVKVEEAEQQESVEQCSEKEHLSAVSQLYPTGSVVGGDLFSDSPPVDDTTLAKVKTSIAAFTKQVSCRKIFVFIQGVVASLKIQNPETCLILSTQTAVAADLCARVAECRGCDGSVFSPIAYTFFSEAFSSYERGLRDSVSQVHCVTNMIGSLLSCKGFSANDYEALITKVTQFAARLVKKDDQCRMVMWCSYLFYDYDGSYKNPQRALECLQRSLKIADVCVSSSPVNLQLFIDILDTYLYHFEKLNSIITDKFISGLIALINEHIDNIGGNPLIFDAKAHFSRIVKHIQEKQTDARFSPIVCNLPS